MNDIKNVLMIVGVLAIITILVVIIMLIVDSIKEYIPYLHIKHIRKHRFDKPPVAKCYCKDCKYWIEEHGDCITFSGWKTADNWFCWKAEPRK